MSLKGLKAFDAAAYCASITAAKRAMREADKKQRRRAAQQQQQQLRAQQRQQQQQQQQQARDISPQSDHNQSAADMGVRPEAGPDSPRSPGRCEGRGGNSAGGAQHPHHHSGGWFGSAGSHPGLQHEQGEEWWRRALARMHIHIHERRHSIA
jgi:hypothetical protein